jgi:hypothetical protein
MFGRHAIFAIKEKVVEVQKASGIVGDVHKSVVDVEKLPEVTWSWKEGIPSRQTIRRKTVANEIQVHKYNYTET